MELQIKGAATPRARATFRVSLLCKAARQLSPYIQRMIFEFLAVRVGVLCPDVDAMLWRCVRQWGDFGFVLTGIVHPNIRKDKPILGMCADLDTKEPEVEDQLKVEIMMRGKDHHSSWRLTRPWNMMCLDLRITSLLEDFRKHFDRRVCGPQAVVEAPWTVQQWQAFCQRWLFGPSEPTQVSLHRWLRPMVTTVQQAPARPHIVRPASPRQVSLDRWLRPRSA